MGAVGQNSLWSKFSHMKWSTQIQVITLCGAFFAAAIVGYIGYDGGKEFIIKGYQDKFNFSAESIQDQVTMLNDVIKSDIGFMANNPNVGIAYNDLERGWKELGEDAQAKLTNLYVIKNSLKDKSGMSDAGDGSAYSNYHKQYQNWFKSFVESKGYYDLFLVDLDGNIIYSYYKESDYATNLKNGEWKDTQLSDIYNEAIAGDKDGNVIHFSDILPYAPSNGALARFVGSPLLSADGKKIGAIILQIPSEKDIAYVAGNFTNDLGKTAETFIVGKDGKLRNLPRFAKEGTDPFSISFNSSYIEPALQGKSGTGFEVINGNEEFVDYHLIKFDHEEYALIQTIDKAELYQDIDAMMNKMVTNGMIAFAVVAFVAYLLTKTMSKTFGEIITNVNKLARGETNIETKNVGIANEAGQIDDALCNFRQNIEETNKLKSVLDNLAMPVMLCDKNYNIVYINKSSNGTIKKLEKLLPVAVDKIVGSNIDIFHKNTDPQRGLLVDSNNLPHSTKFSIGNEWISLNANMLKDINGNFDGAFVDWMIITDEVTNEENAKLAQSDVQSLIEAASAGELDRRIEASKYSGFYKDLANGMNGLMDTVSEPINQAVSVLNSLSSGDLNREMDGQYNGAFNEMQQSVNDTISKLKSIVNQIKETAEQVTSASSEISAGGSDLSMRTEQQASSLEETAASMEELTSTVKQNSQNSETASKLANDAKNVAEKGGSVADQAVSSMETIEKSSQKISDIIGVIDEIAFQTNLLALNAAVEAARAGEAGKGFAVVAAEVRALAGRSSTASKEIKALILESAEQVGEGARLVKQTGTTLGEIVNSVKEVYDLMSDVAMASSQQSSGIGEVNTAISQMDEMTQQNAALVEENTAAAHSLVNQANKLKQLISFFRVDEHASGSNDSFSALPFNPTASLPSPGNANNARKPAAKKVASAGNVQKTSSSNIGKDYDKSWEEF
jgi:methyl-accepting chemotaxis protein